MDKKSLADSGSRPPNPSARAVPIATRDFALWCWSPRGRNKFTRLLLLALESALGVGYLRTNCSQTTATSSAFVWTSNTSASNRWKEETLVARQGKTRRLSFAKRLKKPCKPTEGFTVPFAALLDQIILCSGLTTEREED